MPIRDTFWNIPHWAEIGQYVLAFLAAAIFIYGVVRHVRRWRRGKPERRMDRIPRRLLTVFTQALVQARTAREPYAGIMHLAIFWGMAALAVGTALATIDWDVTHLFFDFQFLKGTAYLVYELILDILGLLVVIGLAMAIYRRYIQRPARLQNAAYRPLAWDDAYVLIMLSLITVTGYLVEGLRIAVLQPDWARWSPVGNAIASIFVAMGDPTNQALHLAIWVAHGVAAFGSLASLPFTKFFHILAAPLNVFFSSTQPAGALAAPRSGTSGVKALGDFTWKQLLDFDACVRCGRCGEQCPVNISGMGLTPCDVMVKMKIHLWERGNGRALHGDVVTPEELWACTACRACVAACPVFTDQLAAIVDLRRHLVNEGRMDTRLQDALANLGRYGNSFGQSERARAKWTQTLEPKIKDARREPVEYLWFVGDYASYNASLADVSRKTAEVFQAAGLDFGILYDAERNSGNDARRVGEEGLFEMLRDKNSAVLEKCTYQALVTTDPHSYNTLRNEYALHGGNGTRVLHYAELLDQRLASGKLRLSKKLGYTVTYHDPCYLGRYNGIYDAPRRVLEAAGCTVREMPRHGDRALCCGAGGGRIWMDEGKVKERPSESRIREAAAVEGVQVMVVACPKDFTMYQDALKTTGQEGRLQVRDLIELVREAL